MDDTLLSSDHLAWREVVRDFVAREISREYVRACDVAREYPYEAYDKIVRAGWLGMLVPEAFGGAGFDLLAYLLMLWELGRFGVDFGTVFAIPAFCVMNIVRHGTPEQQDRYLRAFLEGRVRFSISITEPEAGSDVAAVSTQAVLDGEEYVINGNKLYASAAHVKDNVICMLVRTGPVGGRHHGLSLMLVPNDVPGLTMDRLPTVARRATGTNQLYLQDVRVPVGNVIGVAGDGWRLIMEHLELERISVATLYAANAQQAVDDAAAFARERIQFGKAISSFQVIKHTLAQMQTEVDAAAALVQRAATRMAAGRPAVKEVSMAKLFASETLYKVAGEGMQILGGAAQLPDMDMERYWREGKQAMVGAGSSQIHRSIIAKEMGL
jgi:alkylation response protein AidB-like acyl-CoA dehydrogenase